MPEEEESSHLGGQFDVVHQGRSPLSYNRGYDIQRLAVVSPDVTTPDVVTRRTGSAKSVAETDYWNPKVEVGRAASGKPLKTPKVVDNPSAAAPGTASFMDFEDRGHEVYVHYMNTRQDLRGQGHGNRLMDHLAGQFPDKDINLGQIESTSVGNMQRRLRQQGRTVRSKGGW